MLLAILFLIAAYLLGSLNSAILICKLMKLPDPRLDGSGNPGATNVLRVAGKLPGILVLVGDVLKGLIPVLLAKVVGVSGFMLALVALAAVIGHIFPIFFEFKGGKGAATAFGGFLALSLWVSIIVIFIWAVITFTARYISLATLIATTLGAILILFDHSNYFLPCAVMAGLIIWRHWDNIERLKAGTENKFELK